MSATSLATRPKPDRVQVLLQSAVGRLGVPAVVSFRTWAAVSVVRKGWREVGIRIVDREESAALNSAYRGKAGPTNVLSFPFEPPVGVVSPMLGDLVICAPVVAAEAEEQGKPLRSHWAHLTVHGLLHLQGYDHMDETEAREMERLEIRILKKLGIPDPYL